MVYFNDAGTTDSSTYRHPLSLHYALPIVVAANFFKPFRGISRGILYFQHFERAHLLIVFQTRLQVIVPGRYGPVQFNGVFQRQLGSRSDRKMGGMGGIAHQNKGNTPAIGQFLAMHPGIANNPGETDQYGRPTQLRGVAYKPVTAHPGSKQKTKSSVERK